MDTLEVLRLQHLDEPRRAADEPRRADDEPGLEGDLAARGRAAEELLDIDVIDYVRLR